MSTTFTHRVFPPFRLDSVNQCLWREDARISLPPKTFAVLRYLVENAGRLVTQEELLEAVWPGTYVQPEILRKYILEIRKALGDPPKNPLFIETLPRRGYQFIARVSPELPPSQTDAEPAAVLPTLVGRDQVLAALTSHLSSALRGHREFVFVTGEAGIGKTTLLDAFEYRIANSENVSIARGQCVEGFAGKEAYYPLLEALGQLLRGPAGESVLQVLSTHAPAWLIQFPFAIRPERRQALQREIIGVTRERMVRELCEALEKLATNQTLVLILEDLHWVDDSTLDAISALARRRGTARFLLLGTYRPVDVILSRSPLKGLKQDLLVRHLCHELSLERLTESEVGLFLDERFPQNPVTADLRGLIHRRSDGNPMFMVAMAEQIREDGLVIQKVPPTLQQMMEIQLEQLGEPELHLLRAGSIVGQKFSAWAVGALLDGDSSQQETVCEQLAGRQQFLKRAGVQNLPDGSESLQYEFKHALYREVLYRQIPATRLRQMHLRLADRLEALPAPLGPALLSDLAIHLEEGRSHERAVKYLILASAEAARRYNHDDSLRLLQHALELLPNIGPDGSAELEIQILEKISDELYAQGEMEQSAEIDQRVVHLAAHRGLTIVQVIALMRLARALAFLEPDRCIAVCEKAVELGRTLNQPLLQARAEMLAACWRIITHGLRQEDAAICVAAREKIRHLSDDVPAYYEILYAHVQGILGDYQAAYDTAQAGIPKAVGDDNLVVYLSAHSSLAQALLPLGRIGELQQVLDRALAVAAKNGNSPWLGIFRATQGWLHLQMRDLEGARRIAEELLETHTDEPAGQVRTTALITVAFADLESGDLDPALRCFTQVCERPLLPRFFLDWYWRLIGRVGLASALLAKGNLDEAKAAVDALVQTAASAANPATNAIVWNVKARVALAAGELDSAGDSVERALASLEAFHVPTAAWRIHATAAKYYTHVGDSQAAERHRASAEAAVRMLVSSLPSGDPLRDSLLSAAGL
ncbi:MAG: transcriptional regulator, putative ATPase, winged helix family [Bryobacterales bacterium]|nr:transcriptional regulator, putative ATPase, winged helix family [Bryobacterales bacterium]